MISLLLNLTGQLGITETLIGAGIMIPSLVCYLTGLLPNLPLISFLKMVRRTRCVGVKRRRENSLSGQFMIWWLLWHKIWKVKVTPRVKLFI